MKIPLLIPALAAILGLALAGAPLTAQAQTTPASAPAKAAKKAKNSEARGTLTAVDATANTLTVETTSKKNGTKTISLNTSATTKIKRDGKAATLADFKVGEKVTVTYAKEASGTLTAATLTFNTPKAAKSKTAAKSTTPAPATPSN